MPTNLDILRANLWLRDLGAEYLSSLAEISYRRRLAETQLLVAKDERPEGMCIVITGRILDSISSVDGRESAFSSVGPRSLWGVVAVLDRGGAAHDVRALEETELLVIPTDPLHALLERHPMLYAHFVKILCYRLRKAYTAVSELALASLRQRVARQLCTLGTPIGGTQARATLSPISLTQEELALRVGATRPSVNRELKEMERQEIIRIGYGTINILDFERLHALCATKRIYEL